MPLSLLFAAMLAAPNPATLNAPRQAFVACLRQFEKKAMSDNVAATAYAGSLSTACPTQIQALKGALVAFDVSVGVKRGQAQSNADRDVQDYLDESKERYADMAPPTS